MTDDRSQKVTVFRWNPTRERAALALANARNETEAAREARIARETLSRWYQHPEFQARVEAHAERIVGAARLELMRNADKAAQTVVDIMYTGMPWHRTRLRAACDILDRVGIKVPERHEHAAAIEVRWETVDYREVLRRALEAGDEPVIDGEVLE
jgi:hypothetical protein